MKKKSIILLFLVLYLYFFQACLASENNIVPDNSMGSIVRSNNNQYYISGGQMAGNHNLFHSFESFNLSHNENAIFFGPFSVKHVINRITGGNSSFINGKISSKISGADFYFVNQAGFIFGPHAQIEIDGSFHASSANYIKFGDDSLFYSMPVNDEILSAEPPKSFGFLNIDSQSIEFIGPGEITEQDWEESSFGLLIKPAKTISFIGGDILMNDGQGYNTIQVDNYGEPVVDENGNQQYTWNSSSDIFAEEGIINLISIKSGGEFEINSRQIHSIDSIKMGEISIFNSINIDASGDKAGTITIRAEKLILNNSTIIAETINFNNKGKIDIFASDILLLKGGNISANTYGFGKGADISIRATEDITFSGESAGKGSGIMMVPWNVGDAGSLFIEANNAYFKEGAYVYSLSKAEGKGGDVEILVKNQLYFSGEDSEGFGSRINGSVDSISGSGGNLLINAHDIFMEGGSNIDYSSYGSGNGGDIDIIASGKIHMKGADSTGYATNISSGSTPWYEGIVGGKGGSINIKASEILIQDGAIISSNSEAARGTESGSSGDISINASHNITLSGLNPYGGYPSGIFAESIGEHAKNSANININCGKISILNGSKISTSTSNTSSAGNILIKSQGLLLISGHALGIEVKPPSQALLEYRENFDTPVFPIPFSGIYSSSLSTLENSGNSGDIFIDAKKIELKNRALISTSSYGGGNAGNININAESIYLLEGAAISSWSHSKNDYLLDSLDYLDKYFVHKGDVVEIVNENEAKYIFMGDHYRRLNELYTIYDESELDELGKKYVLRFGDMAELIKDGQNTHDLYTLSWGEWVKLNAYKTNDIIVPDMNSLYNLASESQNNHLPYGSVVTVIDAGNGRAERFYYYQYYQIGNFEKLNTFIFDNLFEMEQITDSFDFNNDMIAIVKDNNQIYYNDDGFKRVKNYHTTNDLKKLIIPKSGDVLGLKNESNAQNSLIFSGNQWVTINDNITINNMDELEAFEFQSNSVINIKDINKKYLSLNGELIELYSSGDAGEINISALDMLVDQKSSVGTITFGNGMGGNISIVTDNLKLENYSNISAESMGLIGGGNAGEIIINAKNNIQVKNSGSLTTASKDAGGGYIYVSSKNQVYIEDGLISTSANGGDGNGGNILIESKFLSMNKSDIIANAYKGRGGNISIISEHFIKSENSKTQASSRFGLQGSVHVDSPEVDLSRDLILMPGDFSDIDKWIKTPCTKKTGDDLSRLTESGKGGISPQLDNWLTSNYVIKDEILNACNIQIKRAYGNAIKGGFKKSIEYLNNLKPGLLSDSDRLDLYLILSESYKNLGNIKKAKTILLKAIDFFSDKKTLENKAILFSSMGAMFFLNDEGINNAFDYIEESVEIAQKANNSYYLAHALNNLGVCYSLSGDYHEAIASFSKAQKICEKFSDLSEIKIKTMINMLRIWKNAGDKTKCLKLIKTIRDSNIFYKVSFYHTSNIISLAKICQDIKNYFKIENPDLDQLSMDLLIMAAKYSKKLENNYLLSISFASLGELFIKKDNNKALAFTRKAIHKLDLLYFPELLYKWQWQMGRIALIQKRKNMAIKWYEMAIRTIENIKGDFFSTFNKKIFIKQVRPLFLELTSLFLNMADGVSLYSKRKEILFQAIFIMEKLKAYEIKNYFEDECVSIKTYKMPLIDTKTAIIYPIPFKERLSIIVLLNTKILHFKKDLNYENLSISIKRFRELIQTRDDDYIEDANLIYDWLIKDIKGVLKINSIKTLVIAPEGILRLLPFSALHDGKSFMAKKYAIVTIPSILLSDTEISKNQEMNILISGLSESRLGFEALPGVVQEVSSINKIMGGEILLDKDFTIKNIREKLKFNNYNIIHMATHGCFSGRQKDTFLLTYNNKLIMKNLEKIIGLGNYYDKKIDLLTLSACQSGVSDDRAAFGLAGIALRAGTKSAVATLWKIDDKASFQFISHFYKQIKNGDEKAIAIQSAQQKMLSISKYKHPYYWAPFILIGNWY